MLDIPGDEISMLQNMLEFEDEEKEKMKEDKNEKKKEEESG